MKIKRKVDRHKKQLTYLRLSKEERADIQKRADADGRTMASMLWKLVMIGRSVMDAPPSLEKEIYTNGYRR